MDDETATAKLVDHFQVHLKNAISAAISLAKYPTELHLKFERLDDHPKLNESHLPFSGGKMPDSVDHRSKMPPVYSQGMLSSCTANALVAIYSFHYGGFEGSRLFLYYNERVLENCVSSDKGVSLSTAVKALYAQGLCPEVNWPYNSGTVTVKPLDACYTLAAAREPITYHLIAHTIPAIKAALAQGYPLMVGLAIFASIMSNEVAKTGVVPMPTAGDKCDGGHAVVIVGYDDTKNGGSWIMRNSWGESWGDKGHFYLPYAYLLDAHLCMDIWLVCHESKTPIPVHTPIHPDLHTLVPAGNGKQGNVNFNLEHSTLAKK